MELNYFIDHAIATVQLTLTDWQLIADTKGKGLADKQRIVNILLSGLRYFCLTPVAKVQDLHSVSTQGDFSYDAEFIFTYAENNKLKHKRVFVNSRDEDFIKLLNELVKSRPDASLLHLPYQKALKKMGVSAASKSIRIVLAILIGLPVLIAVIYLIIKVR